MNETPFGPGSGTVRPLLFERFTDAGTGGGSLGLAGPSGTRADVEASVARELGTLLNTRVSREVDAIEPKDRTVLDYGMPDYSGMSSASETDRRIISRYVERAVRAFEPRLSNPRVSVVNEMVATSTMEFLISGSLTVNNVAAMCSFQLIPSDGTADGE